MLSLKRVYRARDGEPCGSAPRERECEARASAETMLVNLHPERSIRLYRPARPEDDQLGGAYWAYTAETRDSWVADFVAV
jgi:hypothetical protein